MPVILEPEPVNLLSQVQAESSLRRQDIDKVIAPQQEAVDLDDATDAEGVLLKQWKRCRVALDRLPKQPGYPGTIDWPAALFACGYSAAVHDVLIDLIQTLFVTVVAAWLVRRVAVTRDAVCLVSTAIWAVEVMRAP